MVSRSFYSDTMPRMHSSDTSSDAHAAQVAVYKRLGPEKRVALAFQMSEEARSISAGGIGDRHPEYSEADIRWALFRLIHGDELFQRAWPNAPLLKP
jgi:hypothetical protein